MADIEGKLFLTREVSATEEKVPRLRTQEAPSSERSVTTAMWRSMQDKKWLFCVLDRTVDVMELTVLEGQSKTLDSLIIISLKFVRKVILKELAFKPLTTHDKLSISRSYVGVRSV